MSPVTSPLTIPIFSRKSKNNSEIESDPEGPAPPRWKPSCNLDQEGKMKSTVDQKEVRHEVITKCVQQSDQLLEKTQSPQRNATVQTFCSEEKNEFVETKSSSSSFKTMAMLGLITKIEVSET